MCSFSVMAAESNIITQEYTLTFGEVSPSGYSEAKWIDEDGNDAEINVKKSAHDKKSSDKSFRTKNVLPSQYNASQEGKVTSVKNQGSTGSCWAFSMVSIAESNLISNSLADVQSIDLSEAHHVWFSQRSYVEKNESDPTSGDGITVDYPYKNGGNWLRSTFSLARGMGFADESNFPFYAYNEDLMGNYDENERYISNWYLKDAYMIDKSEADEIKQRIMKSGGVSAALYLSDQYLNKNSGKYCYNCPEENSTNHQITIVGWDDTYNKENFLPSYAPDSDGAWIAKNSYGQSWGNQGFFYISYCDKTIKNFCTVDVCSTDNFDKIYQYDGYGYSTGISALSDGEKIKRASFSNVFTANENQSIEAVSFYTLNDDVNYNIEIYTGVDKQHNNPVQGGKCVCEQNGFAKYEGYHTIKLSDVVSVEENQCFSVVVTFDCESGAYLPFEGQSGVNDGSYNRFYSSDSAQSYYKFASYSWKEASGTNYNNACIKAFATSQEVMEIKNANDLLDFANMVNSSNSFGDKTVRLMEDIDMSGVKMIPIGNAQCPFNGMFDGNAKVIKNLSVSGTENVGLFGVTGSSSVIKLLGVENANIQGIKNVGALAGMSESVKIYNCYCISNVKGNENVGGLIGFDRSLSVENCYCISDVKAENTVGAFIGNAGASYQNCYCTNDISTVGNAFDSGGINAVSYDKFKNGYVAYNISSNVIVWTKGNLWPVFSMDESDKVNMATVYDKNESKFLYVYLTKYENIVSLLIEQRDKYDCFVYTDYSCEEEFTGSVTFNRTLFAVFTPAQIRLVENSFYSIEDSILTGVSQETEVSQLKDRIENSNIVFKNADLKEVTDDQVICTGFKICLLNRFGDIIDEIVVSVNGDLNSDGYADAFDLSILSSVANYETEFEEGSVLQKSGDLTCDGCIDSFDYAVLASIVNFAY